MAERKNKFLIKRSNIPGKVPTQGDLLLGELALNTADVILYTSGTTENSILPIGWDRVSRTGDTMTGNLFAPSLSATTISGETYFGDGSNLTNIDNFYTTGTTAIDGTIYFDRNDTLSAYTMTVNGLMGDISYTIWAEENGPLADGTREWSFGNGAVGTVNVFCMYDGKITKMFLQAETEGTTATIDVMINDTIAGTGSFSGNGVYTFPSEIEVFEGDEIGFRTNTVTGSWTDVRTGVAVVQTITGLKGDTGDTGPEWSGGTVNGATIFTNGLTATTISASTFYGDGSNLTGIDDFFVTGGTVSSGGTLTLTRNDSNDVIITGLTSSDQIITNDSIIDVYQTGSTTTTGAYVDVVWDSDSIVGSDFSYTGSEITILNDGYYEIVYSLSIEATGGGRKTSRNIIVLDTGGGYNEIQRTATYGYHRNTASGQMSVGKNVKQQFSAGDKIKVQISVFSGSGTIGTISGDSNITITKLAV